MVGARPLEVLPGADGHVRVLIIDHYYAGFVRAHYAANPGLSEASYEVQARSLDQELFGETQFQISALESLGHEAMFLPLNVPYLIHAWARERGVRLPRRMGVRCTRGRWSLPRPVRSERASWLKSAILAVAGSFRPDVVHIQCLDTIPIEIIAAIRTPGRLVTGQSATPVVPWSELGLLDMFVSSFPHYVERARNSGVTAAYLPLAFEPKLTRHLDALPRDIHISFVGGLSDYHLRRIELLGHLAGRLTIDAWVPELPAQWRMSPPGGIRFHGPAWGRSMYDVLGRSQITVNVHGEIASGFANNLRLYEATGMGALLITEKADNLADLFEPGVEVVTYRDGDELADVVEQYSRRPAEASEIAARGQARTLRDHTWEQRMGQFVSIVESSAPGIARMRARGVHGA